ncbi:MAG TPA: N-acetyltransferase [Fimbriimonadaceae bacterium]|nr:N-acetyltransferase [Fimbriimonadaceae bacterium]
MQPDLLEPNESLDGYSRVMARAFVNYPVSVRTFGTDPARQENWLYRMAFEAAEFRRRANHPIPLMRLDGRVIAAANLKLTTLEPPEGADEWFSGFLAEAGPPAGDFFPRMIARMDHIKFPEPHGYLIMIGVDPDYKGQGVGKALIEYCCQLTKEIPYAKGMGLDTQDVQNVAIYERCGFHVVEEISLDDMPIYSMWREF